MLQVLNFIFENKSGKYPTIGEVSLYFRKKLYTVIKINLMKDK